MEQTNENEPLMVIGSWRLLGRGVYATRLSVIPAGEPIFSEMVTHVEIDDEAVGEFLVLTQPGGHIRKNGISITPEEWPKIKAAVEGLLEVIKQREATALPNENEG